MNQDRKNEYRIHFYISRDLRNKINDYVQKEGISISDLARHALLTYLKKRTTETELIEACNLFELTLSRKK